jgi:hypothetical protein
MAGEFITACGGSSDEVEIGQIGVLKGLLEKVTVYGLDADGYERDKVELTFSGDASGDVHLDLDGGNRSAIEAMDAGLGRAVVHASNRMQRRGLRPAVRYTFTPEVKADPQRLAAARAELGVGPVDDPPIASGYERREILRLRPAKDSGILGSFSTIFKE